MDKGSIGLMHSLAKAVNEGRISEEVAKSQILPEKHESLEKIIRQTGPNSNNDTYQTDSTYRNGFNSIGGFFRH